MPKLVSVWPPRHRAGWVRGLTVALTLALALAAPSAFAALGSGARPPDATVRDEVAFARRGSLSANSYVVTNVVPALPSYSLVPSASALAAPASNVIALVDRACMRVAISTDTTFALPDPPAKRAVDTYRAARALLLTVAAPTNGVLPRVTFTGATRLMTATYDDLTLEPGETVFAFSEFAEGAFLVEKRGLTEIH